MLMTEKVNRLKLTHRIEPVKQETYSNFVIIGCVSLWLSFLFAECSFFLWKSSHVQRHETKLANFFWHQRQQKRQQEEVIWEGRPPLRQLTFPGSRVLFKFKQQLIAHSSTIGDFMKTCRELYCEQKNKESCIYILIIIIIILKLRITCSHTTSCSM